jgi:hypothetical protein
MPRETGSKPSANANSDQAQAKRRARDEDKNGVMDEALAESFPASDPPAPTASVIPGGPRRPTHEERREVVPEPSDADA